MDKDDNVWVLTRPNDTMPDESQGGLTPPISDCCRRPPAMIHIDKAGNVIGSFDPPQGHGMDVDSQGFVYVGNTVNGKAMSASTIPRPARWSKNFLARLKFNRVAAVVVQLPQLMQPLGPGQVVVVVAPPQRAADVVVRQVAARRSRAWWCGGGRCGAGAPGPRAAQAAAIAAFRAKYPPTSPMIVGGIEEIRLDEPADELYVADNYLGGRVMVFDLDTFAFKRGWGAKGTPLTQISIDESDRAYTPGGPMPKNFAGHLTFNFSNDGLVYAADRNANRIDVTDKQGKFIKEFTIAEMTGNGGSTGGVAFSSDKEQK